MADFWTLDGTLEALGNAELKKDGTEYSAVRVFRADGQRVTLGKVAVGPVAGMDLALGATVRMLGFRMPEGSVVYAVVRDGQASSDAALWAKARRVGTRLGWLMAALGICLIPTIVGVLLTAVLVPFGLYVVRKASKGPTLAEMDARVAEAMAGDERAKRAA